MHTPHKSLNRTHAAIIVGVPAVAAAERRSAASLKFFVLGRSRIALKLRLACRSDLLLMQRKRSSRASGGLAVKQVGLPRVDRGSLEAT
jgi:hypothetical protein